MELRKSSEPSRFSYIHILLFTDVALKSLYNRVFYLKDTRLEFCNSPIGGSNSVFLSF